LFYYIVIPLVSNYLSPSPYFLQLSLICIVACIGIAIGFSLPLFDSRFQHDASGIIINAKIFHGVVWSSFIIFLIVTVVTAPSIPFLSAFSGASANELSQERGEFFKARQGAELVLAYMGTIFTTTLLPYSLA